MLDEYHVPSPYDLGGRELGLPAVPDRTFVVSYPVDTHFRFVFSL